MKNGKWRRNWTYRITSQLLDVVVVVVVRASSSVAGWRIDSIISGWGCLRAASKRRVMYPTRSHSPVLSIFTPTTCRRVDEPRRKQWKRMKCIDNGDAWWEVFDGHSNWELKLLTTRGCYNIRPRHIPSSGWWYCLSLNGSVCPSSRFNASFSFKGFVGFILWSAGEFVAYIDIAHTISGSVSRILYSPSTSPSMQTHDEWRKFIISNHVLEEAQHRAGSLFIPTGRGGALGMALVPTPHVSYSSCWHRQPRTLTQLLKEDHREGEFLCIWKSQ